MPVYNVHIYREMKLRFDGIEANDPEQAALIANDADIEDADSIAPCDGETFSALVDVQGDEEFRHSRMIDFESERLRKAAPKLLEALEGCLFALDEDMDGFGPTRQQAIEAARAAIAEAKGGSA